MYFMSASPRSSGRRRRARSCGRARRAAPRRRVAQQLLDVVDAAAACGSRPASASANAFIRKSRPAYDGSARSRRSRNAAISSSFVRFSMKYSSTSSLGLERAQRGLWRSWRSSRRTVGVLEIPEHADAPDHNVAADLVHVERRADRPQHQDRQRAAQVLAELVQPAQHARRVRSSASRCWPSSGT